MILPTRTYLTVVEAGVAEPAPGGLAQAITLAIPAPTQPLVPGDVLIIAARAPAAAEVRAA